VFSSVSALAQQASPDMSAPDDPDDVEETGYIRILHFERPLALDDIEAGRIILDFDPFAQPVEPLLTSVVAAPAPLLAGLGAENQAYLQRLRSIESYEQALEQLEYEGGAWSAELGEELTRLGTLLYDQGEFEESIKVFDRAVHVSRV